MTKFLRSLISATGALSPLHSVRLPARCAPSGSRLELPRLPRLIALATIAVASASVPLQSVTAQTWPAPTSSLRLTVRPHDMVLGTRNAKAGLEEVNTHHDSIYVPPKAVGARRAPLLVMFGDAISSVRPMSDKFGIIVVTLRAGWDDVRYRGGITGMDSALHHVLSHYAIDPNKIALMGFSGSGNLSMIIGCRNLDVFSNLVLLSPIPGDEYGACEARKRASGTGARIFLTMGIGEPSIVLADALRTTPQARADGHPVQLVLDLRPHRGRQQDTGNVFQWLANDWASPRLVPTPASLESVVPLTTDILAKMTSFWNTYRDDHPDAWPEDAPDIWPAVNVKAVRIPIARDTVTVFDMTDLPAIAAHDSSVRRALDKAGLTFAQELSYRAAVIGARATLVASHKGPDLGAIPALQQNVTFFKDHLEAANALLDLMVGEIRCEAGSQEKMIPGSCE